MLFYCSLSSSHPSLSRTDGIHRPYCKIFLESVEGSVLLSSFTLGHQRGFAAIAVYSGKIRSFLSIESPAAFIACLIIAEISIVWRLFEKLIISNLFSVSRSTYIFYLPTLLSFFVVFSYSSERVHNLD